MPTTSSYSRSRTLIVLDLVLDVQNVVVLAVEDLVLVLVFDIEDVVLDVKDVDDLNIVEDKVVDVEDLDVEDRGHRPRCRGGRRSRGRAP